MAGSGGSTASQCFAFKVSAATVLTDAGSCQLIALNRIVDLVKVSVLLLRNNTAVELRLDEGCQGTGWRINESTNPEYIELCPASCDSLTPDTVIQIDGGCGGPIVG